MANIKTGALPQKGPERVLDLSVLSDETLEEMLAVLHRAGGGQPAIDLAPGEPEGHWSVPSSGGTAP